MSFFLLEWENYSETIINNHMRKLGKIKPKPPYNLSLTLDVLQRYAHPALDVARDGAYWRLLYCQRGLNLVRVRDVSKSSAKPRLEVALAMSTAPADPKAILKTVEHILGAQVDYTPFYAYARQHPALWRVVEPLQGLHWLRTESVFEALMLTIIEQQIAWKAAQRAQRWLVEWGNHTITYDGYQHFAFPRPSQIAAASLDDLHPLKITFRRMAVMRDIAGQVVNGTLKLEKLRKQSPQKAYVNLVALKGIGHWTAAWTLQRTQPTQHNYVGYNDVALQAAANHYFYGEQGKLTPEATRDTFAQFGAFAGIAANYTIMRWVLDRYEQQSER